MCQICNRMGHRASDCYQRYDVAEPKDSTVQAYFSTPSSTPDSAWYRDLGATHHSTYDFTNRNFRSENYNGPDKVHMCNGIGLSIKHIGDSLFSSPTASFLLHNVHHVHSITKNLLSVHKFTLETKTYIEFHPWHFFVKEQGSGKFLLRDLNENGLYKLPPTISPRPSLSSPSSSQSFLCHIQSSISPHVSSSQASALFGERTSLQTWQLQIWPSSFPSLFRCSLQI